MIIYLFLLIKKIYSIPGTEDEIYSSETQANEANKVNLNEVCPCNKVEGVCDMGCCCDKDCIKFMLDQNYYDLFSDCDPSSSFSKNIHSKLDYCDDHKKSVDDLFNPLTLAFKVLKKGFCLANDNSKLNNNNNENYYDQEIAKNENNQENKNNYQGEEYTNFETGNFSASNIGEFQKMRFNVPIALPSGMCLFGHFQIKKFQDYEVTCSYRKTNHSTIVNYFQVDSSSMKKFTIYDNYYYAEDNQNYENNDDYRIKKIEIIYYNESNNVLINHYYYYQINNNNNYSDLTLVVRFLSDENLNEYPKSGNPGYIKGMPILIKNKLNQIFGNDNNSDWYSIYNIFPLEKNEVCNNVPNISNNQSFYFDNYMDNKLTFEDFIIYGYKNQTCFRNILEENYLSINTDKSYGKFGNANINNINDWEAIKDEELLNKFNIFNSFTILGAYKEVGTVNNTQFQAIQLNFHVNDENGGNILYFISKFVKPKVETKWWYAPGPGFIRLPRNIMYPFRIGTTTYEN